MALPGYESTEDVRRRLNLKSRRLIQRWCEQGKLPCVKVGRDYLIERGAEPSVVRRGNREER